MEVCCRYLAFIQFHFGATRKHAFVFIHFQNQPCIVPDTWFRDAWAFLESPWYALEISFNLIPGVVVFFVFEVKINASFAFVNLLILGAEQCSLFFG